MARRSWIRRVVGAGVLAGAAYAVWRAIEANRPSGDTEREPEPFPFPPQPRAAGTAAADAPGTVTAPAEGAAAEAATIEEVPVEDAWIESSDGTCPTSHPVKVARSSKVFHVPGGQMYERTSAERCYRDPAAAEADGLRASKR